MAFALLISALVLTSAWLSLAEAHGPCVCTAPAGSADQRARHAYKKALVQAATAAPGTTLEVESRAIQAIWNPNPSERGIAMAGGLSDPSWRRADQPTVTVFDNQPAVTDPANKRAANGFSFEVPDVDPGRYLLLIYDGGEGGYHSTWDFVRVPSSRPGGNLTSQQQGTNAASDEDGEFPFVALLIVAAGAVIASIMLWRGQH